MALAHEFGPFEVVDLGERDASRLPAVQRPESMRFAEAMAPSGWYISAND